MRIGGKKVASYGAAELAKGVNLAAAALTAGPGRRPGQGGQDGGRGEEQYYHDRIFRGVVLSQVTIPDWLGSS